MQNLEWFCKVGVCKNRNQILFSFEKISPQVTIKLWSFGKKFQGHLWWKRSIKTNCFIMNLFMQTLWSVPTSIVPLSGGGGSQSTELEGPRSRSGTQPHRESSGHLRCDHASHGEVQWVWADGAVIYTCLACVHMVPRASSTYKVALTAAFGKTFSTCLEEKNQTQ